MSRVLIKTHALLGDFVCSEPSLRTLCRRHADDDIFVETIFGSFLRWYPFPVHVLQPVEFKEKADFEYLLICDGNGHLVHKVADINQLSLDDDLPDFNIPVPPPSRDPYYLLSAETTAQYRRWPTELWEELIVKLDAPAIQVGKWGSIRLQNADQSLLGRELDPEVLAGLIVNSKVFITIDSGLSHVSAAVKKPYVVLMDRVPSEWRMHEGYTNPIFKDDINAVTVDEVLELVSKASPT